MIEEIQNIKTNNKAIRDFGFIIGCLLLIIAGILFYKMSYLNLVMISLGFSFIGLGLVLPVIIKPFYLLWMYFAVILGWFMTRLILGLLFYIIVSPIGVILRLFGKEFLGLGKKLSNKSYWNHINKKNVNYRHFEKQF